jgi:hypothetical protein
MAKRACMTVAIGKKYERGDRCHFLHALDKMHVDTTISKIAMDENGKHGATRHD